VGRSVAMLIRHTFIVSLLAVFGYASAASANSCSNVDVIGTFNRSGLEENEDVVYAVGTFRIQGEEDEGKQPMFNFTTVNCEKQVDEMGRRRGFGCKVTKAVVWAKSDKPNVDNPNCSLDLDASTYSMKELQKGILTGMEEASSACYNTIQTIDRNTKRVYMSFTKTKSRSKNLLSLMNQL
jgi:hypothetical protein